MRKHLVKLFIGREPNEDRQPIDVIGSHSTMLKQVWNGRSYDDFGLERLFRLFLIMSKFLFPTLYMEHFFGKISFTAKKAWIEVYVLFKTFFPFFVLINGLSARTVFLFLTVYLLIETFIVIFNRIFVSEHYEGEGYKRSLLLLFFNFVEVVLSFAVIYSTGMYLNKPPNDYIDALYFSMMTEATVGYGDIHPVNSTGKLLVMGQALTSIAFLVLFFNFFNSKLED
ncbi:MAG: potassium channel protein [Sphingobacteriaceae bacterium]|jgi:hypothetical protein|nr:potassium channel protein [Sphingobacteriaceae bacterium]